VRKIIYLLTRNNRNAVFFFPGLEMGRTDPKTLDFSTKMCWYKMKAIPGSIMPKI